MQIAEVEKVYFRSQILDHPSIGEYHGFEQATIILQQTVLEQEYGPVLSNSVTECMLNGDHCQVDWLMLSLLTTDRNDLSSKVWMAYQNSEEVHEPRFESFSNGY